ncbi:MAG: CBS domain-containing protein [bacterium]
MKIRNVIEAKGHEDVFTIPMDACVSDFIRTAVKLRVGALLVADEKGRMVGILSERDIMRHCEKKTDFDHTHVGTIMTRDLITADIDDNINKAMDLMIKGRIRHLPILDGTRIAGLITVRDLIHAMRKAEQAELAKLVEYLKSEIDSGNAEP